MTSDPYPTIENKRECHRKSSDVWLKEGSVNKNRRNKKNRIEL